MFNYADSQNISAIGLDIIEQANEFNVAINNLFDKIKNMPSDNIWIGNKADEYVANVLLEKQQYLDFYVVLKEFATSLIESSENINDCINLTEEGSVYKI